MLKNLVVLFVLFPSLAHGSTWYDSAPKVVQKVKSRYENKVKSVCKQSKCSGEVDLKLVLSIISVESNGNPKALSKSNAKGLMQLKDISARDVGVKGNLFDSNVNILAGTQYLLSLRNRYGFSGIDEIALAYSKGPTGAKHYLKQNKAMYHEYVQRVEYAYFLFLLLE